MRPWDWRTTPSGEAYVQVIDEPILRLYGVDLETIAKKFKASARSLILRKTT